MHNKIFIALVLLSSLVIGTIGKECYQCLACPKPFGNNKEGVTKVTVNDDHYCFKGVEQLTGVEVRGDAGTSCTPVDKAYFCCSGNLCNAATNNPLSVQLLVATVCLFLTVRFFY